MTGSLTLSVRPATEADSRRVWEWANDPVVRASSFSPQPIAWEDHVEWFRARLASSSVTYIVVDERERAIGLVRFDRHSDTSFEIGVLVAAEFRGHGLSSPAIQVACDAVRHASCEIGIVARVRIENAASLAAFKRAGFVVVGPEQVRGCDATRLELGPAQP